MSESNQNVGKCQVNGPISVDIPRGWTRILENDVVLYISPSNARLRSVDHVTEYLKMDGTCKCGLECPLYIHKVFNFDANVKSRFVREDDETKAASFQSKCKHHKENVDQNKAAAPARPRSRKTSKSRVPLQKATVPPRLVSPLSTSPPPTTCLVNNNPVQSVPSNLGREQGPLPGFASFVSSSKFFNTSTSLASMLPGTSAASIDTTTSVSLTTVTTAVSRPRASTTVTPTTAVGPIVQTALAESTKTPSTTASASIKVPPTSLKTSSNIVSSERQVPSIVAASIAKQQTKVSPQTVAALSSSSVTSVSRTLATAATPAMSTVDTAAVSRTVTRPIILGSPTNRGNTKHSPAWRGKAKAKAEARAVTATTSKFNSGSSASAAVVTPSNTATTVSSAMLAAHSSSAFVSQRPKLPALVPVSFKASGKAPVSTHGAAVSATPHHGLGSTPVPLNPTQSPAMVPNVAAMTSVYQNTAVASFQQPLAHRGPTSAVPVYATPTAGVYRQPQVNILGGSGHGTPLTTPAGAFAQGQASATVPQGTAAVVTAPQTQGTVVPGVLVQGAGGSQLFQMNFHNLDMGQFKAAYQLQGAFYQQPFAGNAMAVVNTGPKGTYASVPNQSSYASPYMLGTLLMQQANSQANAETTSVTTATAMPATPAGTTYFNQNAAIAAALESFVPIAPAAAPAPTRYSQSLAHLASAYGQFAPSPLLQGSNPMQFPSMQMGSYPTNPMGAPVLSVPEYAFKYPLNTLKQTTYGPVATTTTQSTAKSQVPTSVVAAIPYVSYGQMAGPRLPISLNFTSPGQGNHVNAITVCGETSLTTSMHPQYTGTGNVEAKAGSAKTPPGNTATSSSVPGLTGCGASAFTSFQAQPKLAGTSLQSSNAQPAQTASSDPGTTASATNHQRTACITAPSGNSFSGASGSSPSASESWMKRSSCMLGNSFSGGGSVILTTSSCTQPTHSAQKVGLSLGDSLKVNQSSQMQTALKQTQSPYHGPPKTVCSPLNALSQGYFASRETATSAASTSSHIQNELSPKASVSVSSTIGSGGAKRSFLNDVSQQSEAEGAKRTKYDPKDANYYETNPLLGLKRSCEAIEVYCEADAEKTNDKESKEMCEKISNDGKTACDRKLDETGDELSSCKGSTIASGFSELKTNTSCNLAPPPLSESAVASCEPSALYNGQSARINESVPEAPTSTKLAHCLSLKTVPILPTAFSLPPFLGEAAIPQTRPHFEIGDIVWAQARGLPSWPGKIVDETEVGKGRPDDGKKWVMWFGDNTFSQVEVDRLKTLTEGLRTLDDKARKKKYRAKKARISLEQAISEALEALEMREKLRMRQASKGKAKKKRIR